MVGGWDGEAGDGDGCASGGRYEEQSEGDGGTSLAVMEADVLWSNGSCVCLCLSVSGMLVSVCIFVCGPTRCPRVCVCLCKVSLPVCECTVCVFVVEALQPCDGSVKAV